MTATYRLQLRPEFGFADAEAVVPYLADLDIVQRAPREAAAERS